METKTYYMAWK